RQGQRAAHPNVVERLLLVVGLYEAAAVPVAGVHGDLVAERAYELIAHRGWEAAELDRRAIGPDSVDPNRLLIGIDPGEAVQMRQALMVIVGILRALDRLANLVFDEFEWTRSEDILLVPARVLVEGLLLVNPAVGVGQGRQERARCKLEVEHHGRRVRSLDTVDHDIM